MTPRLPAGRFHRTWFDDIATLADSDNDRPRAALAYTLILRSRLLIPVQPPRTEPTPIGRLALDDGA
jgi:hypothetical protein